MAFTCNLQAIGASERPRHNELVRRIRRTLHSRDEIETGYRYTLSSKFVTLLDVAEWMAMERLCCPFLTFTLSVSGPKPDWSLALTGPEGVKPLLDVEFPVTGP